ncbi:olfactory receptor 10R2-like [Genypterus blacodes]|uniref:olfactory receptor 10R2-like n=1 Tax=Genypterus blacodes TaxID=154954 RepID=UPI003F76DE9F
MANLSSDIAFSLSGFSATVNDRGTLFFFTLLCYSAILFVNMSLILTIVLDKNFHEPMYILLCILCINGLYGTTGFYPKFLLDLLSDFHVVSYAKCLLQIFVIYSYVKIDYSILALMAYDRYVAICRPLEYHSVMSARRISLLVSLSLLVPLSCDVTILSLLSTLKLCSLHIDKLYCENWAVVKLACSLATVNNIFGLCVISLYLGHIVFIVFSYLWLIKAALKSRESRRKCMQTCLPHLLCLFNVTGALLFDVMYSRYGSQYVKQNVKNFMAIQFLLIPPLLNPIIYGIILTKIRNKMICLCVVAGQRFKMRLKI